MLTTYVTVLALKSFDDFREGDVYILVLTERIAHLIAFDYFRRLA
jgi:hypothetical protein